MNHTQTAVSGGAMQLGWIVFALCSLSTAPLSAAGADCADTESALAYWRPLKEQASTTELPADLLALELVDCLASPNAELRDGIGYELLSNWLRNEKLSDETRGSLLDILSAGMARTTADAGLKRSFSALILAELMRSDAIDAFMTAADRQALLDATVDALQRESDYRGLDADIGWVHPVAHMADLLWRFALHPATGSEQASTVLGAVNSKIAPTDVFYAFNESDRLARVVSTLVRRELLESATVAAWLEDFQSPRSMENWSSAFRSPAGMAELHNTKLFIRALSDQLAQGDIDPEIAEPLQALVDGFTGLI